MEKSFLIFLLAATTSSSFGYYNPSQGRWLSRDPIEEKGGVNLYSAMLNKPVDTIDPNGQFGFAATLISEGLLYLGASILTGIIAVWGDVPSCCEGTQISEWQHCTSHCVQAKYFGAATALISGLLTESIPKLVGNNRTTGWSTPEAFWANMNGIVEGLFRQKILGIFPKWWDSCAESCEKQYCKCCKHY